ncbi:MAG: universal stress protein [Planctomycetota bacterium]
MVYKNILVPTDFSKESEVAFEPAIELAKASGGKIILVGVVQEAMNLRMAVLAHSAAVSPEIDDVAANLVESSKTKLQQIADRYKNSGVAISVIATEGLSPARTILELVESEKADLVVLATHGHGGLKRILLGSVAERVVREAKCPVLVAR